MTFSPFVIIGNPAFDYFFSIMFVMGAISVGPSLLFKLLRN